MHCINMFKAKLIICLAPFLFFSCIQSTKLTVAFTQVSVKEGVKVYANDKPIGEVISFNSSNDLDTVFVRLRINNKIRVPRGSVFYIAEELLGESRINVDFSNNSSYLTSKDISVGEFRSLKMQ